MFTAMISTFCLPNGWSPTLPRCLSFNTCLPPGPSRHRVSRLTDGPYGKREKERKERGSAEYAAERKERRGGDAEYAAEREGGGGDALVYRT